jgi:predicted Mrr-cat superfamily restriction endonuclease
MNCWFWNIDKDFADFFNNELQRGILRQGLGYHEELNLNKLQEKVAKNEVLSKEEQEAFNRCCPMLLHIKKGDLICVKNIPTNEHFTIVEVQGEYCFQISEHDDYGHFLPVKIINSFHKDSRIVSKPLTNALNRERNPTRITYKHDLAVKDLCKATDLKDKDQPEAFKEKIERFRGGMISSMKNLLKTNLSPTETERLILELLKNDGINVLWNAGAGEKGADLLCDIQIGYGLVSKIAVQVKMHWDIDFDITGIEQLETAFSAHSVDAGLLVTTAEGLGENVHKRLEEAQKKFNIQALYGEELYSRLIEL